MSDATRFEEKDYSSRFDGRLWLKILRIAKPVYPYLGLTALFMTCIALVDASFPQLTRYAVDRLVPALGEEGAGMRIALFTAAYLLLALFNGLGIWAFILAAGVVEVRLVHLLREKAFKRLQELSFSYYDRTPAGWIMTRMTSDTQKLGDTIAWGVVDLTWGSIIMLMVVIFMLAMNAKLALIGLSFAPFLLFATAWFQKQILAKQRKARKTNSLISGLFNEGLQGARTSKTLVREAENCGEFVRMSGTLRAWSVASARLSALFMPVVILLSATGASLVLGLGGSMVLGGALSFGTLVAFINYALMLFDPAREVARVLSELQAAQASAERLFALVETEPEINDRPGAGDDGDIQGALALDRVSFHYGDGRWILRDFSLSIPAGQTLAVVGETGSGKSTLVNLLCRFYEPVEGAILIDGRDYREKTQHWLHSKLGYVLQSPLLFSGTIRENIRYGRLDASDEEVEAAATKANAKEFIEKLEKGWDSLVGEGGVLLSTGQKQLISLARALVANPRIMVLDEATSSVDTETEVLIQGAVNELLVGRTSIVIAHRLSTIRHADRILVMDHGKIIEDGSHDELMAQHGHYRALYTRQFLEEAVAHGVAG